MTKTEAAEKLTVLGFPAVSAGCLVDLVLTAVGWIELPAPPSAGKPGNILLYGCGHGEVSIIHPYNEADYDNS
jgi:hypothetical protein